jgi:hypothetical protein
MKLFPAGKVEENEDESQKSGEKVFSTDKRPAGVLIGCSATVGAPVKPN